MPYCHRYGEEIAEDARYCPYCGVPIGVETRRGELQVEEIRGPYPFAPSATLEIVVRPPTEFASGEGLKRDASVMIDVGVSSFRIIVDKDVPSLATVRGMTSVATHGGFRRLRRGHLSELSTRTGHTRRRPAPAWSSTWLWAWVASPSTLRRLKNSW